MDANAPVWAAWGVAQFRAVKCDVPIGTLRSIEKQDSLKLK